MTSKKTDGFLYSGITSVSSNRATVREEVKRKKEDKQREVEPFAPAILSIIEKEKAGFGLLLAGLIDSTLTDAEVRTHIEAVKLNRAFVISFESQIKNILRKGRLTVRGTEDE